MVRVIDLESWPRAQTYQHFRSYGRPHFATTARVDATRLIELRRQSGMSPYRASLYAIGEGLHSVPELLTRFRADIVVQHDTIELSMPVPRADGTFGYAYLERVPEFRAFDLAAREEIERVAQSAGFDANAGERDDLAYLSCLPWLDYSSINNAMPGPDDCIPRVSWGKIVEAAGRYSMAMTLEVHHALVDGVHVGAFFSRVQDALDTLPQDVAA